MILAILIPTINTFVIYLFVILVILIPTKFYTYIPASICDPSDLNIPTNTVIYLPASICDPSDPNTHFVVYLPASLVKHVQLVAGSVWVDNDQPRSNDIECSINVHGVRVLEGKHMQPVFVSEMTSHPLNAKMVGNLHHKMGYNTEIYCYYTAI